MSQVGRRKFLIMASALAAAQGLHAQALGQKVPQSVLIRANQVIE